MPRQTHTPRCHVPEALHTGTTIELPREVAHHLLKVLRCRNGDRIELFNGDGLQYEAVLQLDGRQARATLERASQVNRESPLTSVLIQAVSRGERMDSTIRKSVELGVSAIQPLYTRLSAAPLPSDRASRKHRHWQQIAAGACEQSGRTRVPLVLESMSLDALRHALPLWPESGHHVPTTSPEWRLVLVPDAATSLVEVLSERRPLTLLSGPESGLTDEEVAQVTALGFTPVSLGPRVLRTETAAPAALAIAQALCGDLRR